MIERGGGGWRKGEITGLTLAMVDLWSGTVHLPPSSNKSRQGRVLVLSEPLRDVIQRQLQLGTNDQPLVFHTRSLGSRDWRKAGGATREAGCPGVLFHDIRQTVVRNLVRDGVPERMAMAVTGHKTRDVCDRYDTVTEWDVALAIAQLATYVNQDQDKSRTVNQGLGSDKTLLANGRGVAQPGIAHLPWAQGVGGSNPLAPTM